MSKSKKTKSIPDAENWNRAWRGREVLKYYGALPEMDKYAERQTLLVDLLADLMHTSTQLNGGWGNFDQALDTARGHYEAEVQEAI